MPKQDFLKYLMPMNYQSEESKIAAKKKIADALIQRGLTPNKGMISPLEVIGSMAQAFAGKRLDSRASKMEDDLSDRVKGAYADARGQMQNDVAAGMTPQQIAEKYGSNPLLENDVKPYADAFGENLKGRERIVNLGSAAGYGRVGDYMGKPLPNDPNKPVWVGSNGQAEVNPVAATAAMYRNPNLVDPSSMPTSAPIPTPGMPQTAAAPVGSGVTPSPAPAGANVDLSLLSPEEQAILQNEIKRRGSLPPSSRNMPFGNPLRPPPSGTAGGKPYWIVNGVPYDNPEGK